VTNGNSVRLGLDNDWQLAVLVMEQAELEAQVKQATKH
jgi:hypothetical protein